MRTTEEIERCEREIQEIDSRNPEAPDGRAYLATLGRADWECEKRLIAREEDGQ